MAFEFIVKLPSDQSRQFSDLFGDMFDDQPGPLSEIGMVCAGMLPRTVSHRLPFFIHMHSFRVPVGQPDRRRRSRRAHDRFNFVVAELSDDVCKKSDIDPSFFRLHP